MEEFTTTKETPPKDDLKARLIGHINEYVKTYGQLLKIKVTVISSRIAAIIVLGVCTVFLGLLFLIFAFTGIAWWLGGLLKSPAAGFFCVAVFFMILAIITVVLRKKLIYPFIRNTIISKVYE